MADALGDLGEPVHDRTLVLNVLRGLNEKYSHLASLIARQRPFPSFIDVRADLHLEEITQKAKARPIAAFIAASAQATSGSRPPTGGVAAPSSSAHPLALPSTATAIATTTATAATARGMAEGAVGGVVLAVLATLACQRTPGPALSRSGRMPARRFPFRPRALAPRASILP